MSDTVKAEQNIEENNEQNQQQNVKPEELKQQKEDQKSEEKEQQKPEQKGEKEEQKPIEEEFDCFGIDFGSQNTVIACLESGKKLPEVLTNSLTNRETPSLIGFEGTHRVIGESAVNLYHRSEKLVAENLKRLIGYDGCEKWTKAPFEHGRLWFGSKGFTSTQLVAMFLKHLSEFSEGKQNKRKCVLSVPHFFTKAQRETLFGAAEIAGLEPVAIANELTCAAALYSRLRCESTEPIRILLLDQGHTHTSAAVAEVTHDNVKMLSESSVEIGGFHINEKLAKAVMEEVHGVDLESRPRAVARIKREVEKAKKVLSTIPETFVEVEAITESKDFKTKISRAKFESMLDNEAKELNRIIQEALDKANISSSDLNSVEVIGGGLRIPYFVKTIETKLHQKLSHSLPSSSAIAEGATLLLDKEMNIIDNDFIEVKSSLSQEEKNAYLSAESEIRKEEEEIKLANKLMNEIESYSFRVKQDMNDKKYEKVINEEGKKKVLYEMEAVKGWLEENERQNSAVFDEKLKSLQDYVAKMLPEYITFIEKEKEEMKKLLEESKNYKPPVSLKEKRPPRTKAEKLTAAQKRKEQGNTLIKEPDYENAAMRYVQGLGYLEIVHDLTKEEEEQVKTLKVSLLSNLCLCYLKLNKFNKVIENSTKALELDPENNKLLYRRAVANRNLGNFNDALKDLRLAEKKEPENKAIKAEIARSNAEIEKQKAKERRMAKAMFGGSD